MAKKILAVVAGYIVMAVFIFLSFTGLYAILGAEGSFEPGSYEVTVTWIIFSIILSIIAALLGGWICVLIAKDKKAAYWLAGIVFALGIILAIPQLGTQVELNKVREGDTGNTEAMENAEQPHLILILNPIFGAVGVLAGAGFRKST